MPEPQVGDMLYLVTRVQRWPLFDTPGNRGYRLITPPGLGIGFLAVFDSAEAAAEFCKTNGYSATDVARMVVNPLPEAADR